MLGWVGGRAHARITVRTDTLPRRAAPLRVCFASPRVSPTQGNHAIISLLAKLIQVLSDGPPPDSSSPVTLLADVAAFS
eukprot:4560448-Prymnesium_polylepis.1